MTGPKSDRPLVSVVLPAKDAEPTLGRALESMLGQTLPDFEIIVVDDQSADGTAELACTFARSDQRVHVLNTDPPGGLVDALQRGTAAAKGTLIARMDADDVSHPQRLERQVACLNDHPEYAACGCQVNAEGALGEGIRRYVEWSNQLLEPDALERERFVESPLVHPSVLMRKEALDRVGGYRDPGWAEDYDLWLRMFDAGMRVGKVPQVLLEWHDRPRRLTRSDPRYAEDEFLRAKAHFLNRLADSAQKGFALCGAGPIGKKLARFLQKEGAHIRAFFEVHPRRIGETIHGIPVHPHSAIPRANERNSDAPILLSAVGNPGGRDRVRDQLDHLGYAEGSDYFCAS